MAALTARDRAAVLAVLENAQWVYALGRYPKKQVLDDPVDVKMLRDRVEAIRKAAGEMRGSEEEGHPEGDRRTPAARERYAGGGIPDLP